MAPPTPWKQTGLCAIGGMRSIGYSQCSKYILVVGSAGRTVFECNTGKKVARDRAEYYEHETDLIAEGIGPIEGEKVRVSGLFGGGLLSYEPSGWHIEQVVLEWPRVEILLLDSGADLYGDKYGKPSQFSRIFSECEIRGVGFSYSGETLCIGISSDIIIYSRVA